MSLALLVCQGPVLTHIPLIRAGACTGVRKVRKEHEDVILVKTGTQHLYH